MRYLRITPGATSQSITVQILKDDGTANTSLAFNTSGVAFSYRRDNGTLTSITLATLASATASYSSGGFIHVSNGVYRLDLPDAAIASGATRVAIIGAEATDIRPVQTGIDLDEATSTRLAPATAGRTLKLDASGNVTPTATNADGATLATWGSSVVATLKRLDIINDTSAPAVTVSNTSSGNGMSIISGTSGDGAGLFIQSRNTAGYGLYILAASEGVWIESAQSVGLEIHGGDQAIFLGYAENYPSPVEGAGIPCIQTAGSENAGREFLRQELSGYAIVTGGSSLHSDTSTLLSRVPITLSAQSIADAANNTVPAGETISLRAAVEAGGGSAADLTKLEKIAESQ